MQNILLIRKTGDEKQMLPGAVMKMGGLDQAECLLIHAEAGHILISNADLTPREKMRLITYLYDDIDDLCQQLVEASNKVSGEFHLKYDPLCEVDEGVVEDLICMGADEDCLRTLLMKEAEKQDEK